MKLASWGARRVLGVTAVLSLSAMVLVAGGSAARTPDVAGTEGVQTSYWTPMGLRDGSTTVVVQLAGDPVAVVQGNANRKLSKSEKQAIKGQLKAKQDGLRGAIQQLGGTVLADYQSAYNGIKVKIDRSKAAELAKLAGVVAVRPLQVMELNNERGVVLIGTPAVWNGVAGFRGEGVKIAVLDTGIDYTHAMFDGPGTTEAYNTANAADTLPANPLLFGPLAPRVKGGTDLVGDDYNASADPGSPDLIPHPDPNPLDCNGHGSHVAGTAAGSGVLADGSTYKGAYNPTTISGNSWTAAPGVAPEADIYAVRVFGCEGSTDVVVDAIDWAVDNDMDVINMSLGSVFGSNDDPSAVASTNAAKAGVIVVASAGNSGPNQYITGSPASGEGAISVAANDPHETFPGVTITLSNGVTMTGVNANEHPFTGPVSYTVKVIFDNPATTVDPDGAGTRSADESLGCDVGSFGGPLPANTIAVVNRGTCARVAKAIFGQQAGAAAVVMVNNATSLPPIEGPITSNPDDGTPFVVTIPFLGVRGLPTTPTSDGGKLRAANGLGAIVTPTLIPNSNFKGFADFSSGGPRTGDSFLKPDITGPGVSIKSTLSGSGNGPLTISGTSMASPHVAGVAALTRQAHPLWNVADIKAAILNTGNPAGVLVNRISRGGTGLVQPAGSTKTQVVAAAAAGRAGLNAFDVSVNFGFAELSTNFSSTKTIQLRNNGLSPATFNVAQANAAGSPHSLGLSASSVSVPAGGTAEVQITLNVPVATVGASNGAGLSFREVAGLVQFTPASAADNGNVALRVPYYLVPRALSNVTARTEPTSVFARGSSVPSNFNVKLENIGGAIAGDADFYAWGLSDGTNVGTASNDVRAIGVQSFPFNATNQFLGFSVNTFDRWSNPSTNEFDIFVDVDNNGSDDYIVVGVDQGAVQTGAFNGRMGSFVFSTRSGGASINFFAQAPTDSSTANIFVLSSQLCRGDNPATPAVDPEPCLNAANPRFTYSAVSFDLLNGGVDEVDGTAKFNAWSNALSFPNGGFQSLAPGATGTEPVVVNAAEWALTPTKGVMVATLDDRSGSAEASLIELRP